jgi:hypothetical protein
VIAALHRPAIENACPRLAEWFAGCALLPAVSRMNDQRSSRINSRAGLGRLWWSGSHGAGVVAAVTVAPHPLIAAPLPCRLLPAMARQLLKGRALPASWPCLFRHQWQTGSPPFTSQLPACPHGVPSRCRNTSHFVTGFAVGAVAVQLAVTME